MTDTTTIQIDSETWQRLNSKKNPGDSFDDIIRDLLNKDNRAKGDSIRANGTIAALIWQWEPGRNAEEREERRSVGFEALKWLQREGIATRSDFLDALYGDHNPGNVGEKTWWRRSVRPVLNKARDQGVVHFEEGSKKWKWNN